jgi:superfamily II DNA/RNA helicase
MIQSVRKEAQQRVQMLLFSATFNDNVKRFALKVARDDGREDANEVFPKSLPPPGGGGSWIVYQVRKC